MGQKITITNRVSGFTQEVDKDTFENQKPEFKLLFDVSVSAPAKPTAQVQQAAERAAQNGNVQDQKDQKSDDRK